jgi:tetratricopeptide (TPR) repeat protein
MDEVINLMGLCFYKLRFYETSDQVFRRLMRHFSNSELFPKAILSLQKNRYHLGDYRQSLKFHTTLESNYRDFSGLPESRYYALQTYFQQGQFDLALNTAKQIGKKSDVYHFSLYTCGLIHLKKKNVRESLDNLIDVAESSAQTLEGFEIVNSALLTLGYTNFELSRFPESIEYLARISPDFYDYGNSLLALAWSNYKAKNYESVLSILGNLNRRFPDFEGLAEVRFLMGQSYLKLGYFSFALREFETLTTLLPTPEAILSETQTSAVALPEKERATEILESETRTMEQEFVNLLFKNLPFTGLASVDQQNQLNQERRTRYADIVRRHQELAGKKKDLDEIRNRIDTTEQRRKWRSYAEYGRVRALYLDNIVER